MKNLKKLFLVFAIIFTLGAMTACSSSSLNSVQDTFEKADFKTYEFKNSIAVNFNPKSEVQTPDKPSTNAMFIPVDRMSMELKGYILDETNAKDLKVIKTLNYRVFVFAKYEVPTGAPQIDKTVVVIEFDSAEYLQEVLRVSTIIQTQLDGKEIEDHVNGNLLLLVRTMDYYDELVEMFNKGEK